MAITLADFNKIWASTSPLTPYSFSETNYKQGWNFIGGTPPSRQMWDYLQKNNDEKMQYLLNHFDNYLPLSGGTLTGVVNGVTPPNGDNSKKLATTEFVRTIVPAGVVLAYAKGAVPTGWLLCDGSAVSRTNYAALYAVIGTTYGAGNGSTTFNLPNLTDKFIQGSATAGTVKSAGLPNITGKFGRVYGYHDQIVAGGAIAEEHYSTQYHPYGDSTSGAAITYKLDASRSSAIYGNSTTVQPPALTMRYIIKY